MLVENLESVRGLSKIQTLPLSSDTSGGKSVSDSARHLIVFEVGPHMCLPHVVGAKG